MVSDPRETWEAIAALVDQNEPDRLRAFLDSLSPADIARAVSRLEEEDRANLLTQLGPDDAADIIDELPDAQGADILEDLPAEDAAKIIVELETDEQADLLAEIERPEAEAILEEPALPVVLVGRTDRVREQLASFGVRVSHVDSVMVPSSYAALLGWSRPKRRQGRAQRRSNLIDPTGVRPDSPRRCTRSSRRWSWREGPFLATRAPPCAPAGGRLERTSGTP